MDFSGQTENKQTVSARIDSIKKSEAKPDENAKGYDEL